MKKIRLLSLILAFTMLFSSIPVNADTQYTDSNHTVENQNTSTDGEQSTTVYAELGSEFKVTIPKKITLDGATKTGTYKVTVEGDIAGLETIKVQPDASVALNSKNKPSVTGSITQDKTNWKHNEIVIDNKILGNGEIKAQDISAGAWNGTFNFNIKLSEATITVKAENSNGEDLNASAENIINNKKDFLLEELEKSGLADNDEIDAIIEVEADEFDNLAKTVFDVSEIANPGDKIVVLHFDEETQSWEYISTEVVADDGTITVYMDSYSPVAFVKVENNLPEHIHNYTETIINASCTVDGSYVYNCTCGDTYSNIIDKLGHNYVPIITDATCTTEGYTTWECSRCEDSYTDSTVSELGHTYNNWTIIENPTCFKNGKEERNCTVCGFIDSKEINALGHNFASEYTIDKEATCTTDGSKSQHCSRCEAIDNKTIIPALGHDYKQIVTNPTCTVNGYTTNTCSRCNDTYIDNQTSATGHSYTSTITKEATCTEAGNKHYDCINCNYEYNEVIVAKGHVYDSTKYVTDVPATCTTNGQKSVHCNVCNAIITSTITVIPATGHNYGTVTYNWNELTSCTATRICLNNESHIETETINSTNTVTKEATCTETGIRTYTAIFNNTAFVTQTKTETIKATGHTETNGGTEAVHTKCLVCNETLSNKHTYASKITISATCTTKGTSKYTCDCGYNYTKQDIDIDNKNHTGVSISGGTKESHTKYNCCETIISNIHNYTSVVTKEATCTETGIRKHTCDCGYEYEETIVKLGHNFASEYTVDLQPTCLTEGSKSQHCSRCEVTNNTTAIQALGHDYKQTVTNPTCTANGYTTNVCNRCNDTYVDNQVSATGHNYTSTIIKQSTCTTAGNRKYTCSTCNHSYNEAINATGHTYTANKYVTDTPATCTTAGQKSVHCNVCNAVITSTITVIPATGHTNVNGGTSEAHTKCGSCNIVINKSHVYTKTTQTPATCIAMGTSKYTCSCGYSYTKQDIEKTAHTYTSGKCSKCGTLQPNTYTVTYNYTGTIQTFTAPEAGIYKFELWGAEGSAHETYAGGKGGYVYGYKEMKAGETLYICVGSQTGYNGGGTGDSGYSGNGGGATSVCTNNAGANGNALLVAGGGGGASSEGKSTGGDGGGVSSLNGKLGSKINHYDRYLVESTPSAGGAAYDPSGGGWPAGTYIRAGRGIGLSMGTQSNGANLWCGGGGGGGYYGGGAITKCGGGGGSAYIAGMPTISFNGKTYAPGYGGSRTGNGIAKVTFIISTTGN